MSITRYILILSLFILGYCLIVLAMMYPWLAVAIVVALIVYKGRKTVNNFWAHGTARWAAQDDLQKAGMLDADTGLILGRMEYVQPNIVKAAANLFDRRVKADAACEQFIMAVRQFRRRKFDGPLVRLPKAVHTAVFAPTGVGKGVSIVLPFLQSSTESAVVIDFKGENATITAARRKELGHKVVLLDPFKHTTLTPDTLNPLDFIDKNSPTALDDCRDLANALVITTGEEKDPHFTESAKVWIESMVALVVFHGEPGNRSLQTVRTLLSDPNRMADAIKLMCASTAAGGMLARKGHQLTHYKDKELASTLTTTLRFLYFLDTPAVFENTKASSFDPAELTKGKMTVYLVLPPEHMRAQASLLRMWIGAMIRAVVHNGLQEKTLVHFVLDEAASLGKLEPIDDAVDKFRGYGIRLVFLYQSMGQLKKCFPDGQEQTLLSNVTQIFFGVCDKDGADYVSNRLGEETIIVDSGGKNQSSSHSQSKEGDGSVSKTYGTNDNWAQQARKLLKPEEVTALSPRVAITFTPGVPPIASTLTRYYENQKAGWLKLAYQKLEIMAAAIAMLALCAGLAWMVANANNPKGAPNGSVVQQGNGR